MPGPAYHGRTHLPGGTDPIPFNSNGSLGYEMARELLRPADWANSDNGSDTVTPGTYLGTSALITLCDANNEAAYFAMRLGPQGAMYHLQFVCQTSPDAGVFEFQWAQIPSPAFDQGDSYPTDPLTSGPDGLGGTGLIYSPEDVDTLPLTWLSIADWSGIGDVGDLYTAGTVDNEIGGNGGNPNSRFQQFRIMGDLGDVLSTFSAGGSGLTVGTADGGPGIWLLRVKVIGKNPSSSGYNIRMSSLTIQREFFDNFSV